MIHPFSSPQKLNLLTMADDDEDYMSMVIEEPKQKETFTQRKRREQREVYFLLLWSDIPLIAVPGRSSWQSPLQS